MMTIVGGTIAMETRSVTRGTVLAAFWRDRWAASRRLSRAMPVAEVDVEEVGLLMGGIHGETEASDAVPA